MLARSFAFLLLVAAALADSSGAHSGAFYFVLAAGPVPVLVPPTGFVARGTVVPLA